MELDICLNDLTSRGNETPWTFLYSVVAYHSNSSSSQERINAWQSYSKEWYHVRIIPAHAAQCPSSQASFLFSWVPLHRWIHSSSTSLPGYELILREILRRSCTVLATYSMFIWSECSKFHTQTLIFSPRAPEMKNHHSKWPVFFSLSGSQYREETGKAL